MSLIPNNAKEITIEGATVPFHKYEEDGIVFLQFDSSKCGHPEPMVNAMIGLQNLTGDERLVMINHKPPMGLFSKVEAEFDNDVKEIENDLFKITFIKKAGATATTNFNDTACNG